MKLREIAHKVYDQIKSTWGTPPHDFSSAPMNILEKTGEKYSEQDTIKILLITVQNSRVRFACFSIPLSVHSSL